VHGLFATPDIAREDRPDGSVLLSSRTPLGAHPPTLCHHLEARAAEHPDRIFLAERDGDGWRGVGFGEMRRRARGLAQALIDIGLAVGDPVLVISDNAIDHAVVQFAALYAGLPVCPVSTAYAVGSGDFARLRAVAGRLRPRAVYAADPERFGRAVATLGLAGDVPVLDPDAVAALAETPDSPAVDARMAGLGPETVAKVLFTSGSTGGPKGVINTHRMLCANQQMLAQIWPFLTRRPPVLVDWMPWSHTFGGNHNLNMALAQGGTLHIDTGRPVPSDIGRTVENLRSVSPTLYLNVPRGYDALLPYLEADPELRDRFFAELDLLFYGGASLPQSLRERLEALGQSATGRRPTVTTAYGSTETAPLAIGAHHPTEHTGVIGVPVPGTEVLLRPEAGKLSVAMRGPHITPGYLNDPERTAEAFDEEGFWKSGDAVRMTDPERPEAGLVFDGRLAEDFKLLTGTWVAAGTLRLAAIAACAPVAQDVVVAGQDRDSIAILIFPNLGECARIAGLPKGADPAAVVAHPAVRETVRKGLAAHNAAYPSSSTAIARALLLTEPPDVESGEITDKGYINQRGALERRAADVEALYAEPPGEAVIVA